MRATHVMSYMVVEGSGDFPYDMLRYEGACFDTQADVSAAVSDRDLRRVTLRRYSPPGSKPTPERWRSFLWSVVAVEADRSRLSS